MKKLFTILIVIFALSFSSNSYAIGLKDGILNVEWGSTVEQVKEIHPNGIIFASNHWKGAKTYRIRSINRYNGKLVLGIKCPSIDFIFNTDGKLSEIEARPRGGIIEIKPDKENLLIHFFMRQDVYCESYCEYCSFDVEINLK